MDINKVNPKMIVLAREYRGFNQDELSKAIGITQGFLSKIEKGMLTLNEEILESLCEFLALDKNFFIRKGDTFPPNLYYRKKTKTSQKALTRADAEMNIHRINIQELLKSIDINSQALPVFDIVEHGDPKTIAKKLRQVWSVPSGPINNLFHLVERNGVIIALCDFGSMDIDGRSMFTDNRQPIIFLNKNMPSDRQRFTVAHELGHLIMHIDVSVPDDRDIEKEANKFANEFLVPETDLAKQIFKVINLSDLADLKRYWKVSMQAILYKANDCKLISANNHKSLVIQISKSGMKTKEPIELDPPRETTIILSHLINLHLKDLEFSEDELASLLGYKVNEMRDKYLDIDHPKLKIVF